ncbi:ABC transporter ATP-binding protein [Mycolicibacterium sp. BiH015]|uniref:ABC transporter ATP-binding protein n=1 Tax=Mycolicibacterium sp. BiH015 TaxID=3018808 RepID=UPI0022E35393|nr:ABC transporter ATP-binding protein [Mycolicibacterium sp. BiH015]MDA2893309.1 ABC transporter ATP-binding protein [Mycolicibacterium sp. BiH015]
MTADQTARRTRTRDAGRRTDLSASAGALQLANLTKRYGPVEAVRGVSLDVQPAEFLTVLGPSGSGKTTLLSMIAGFERPSEGTIVLGDRDITNLATHKRHLGMIFQGYALFPHMSVFDNVAFPLTLRRTSKSDIRQRVMESLEIVDLARFGDRRPSELSGGQQQRVALARAIVHRPSLLLMDEPLSALDRGLRAQMQIELRKIHQELGSTVLFVTHDQEEALSLSDRIVVMRDGEIAQCGRPSDVYEEPRSEFVARFIGSAQFLRGTLHGPESAARGATLITETGLVLAGRCTGSLRTGETASAVLRPEDASTEHPAEPSNAVTVRVVAQVYLGDRIRCQSLFPDGSEGMIWLNHREASAVHVGEDLNLFWPCTRTVFVAADQ